MDAALPPEMFRKNRSLNLMPQESTRSSQSVGCILDVEDGTLLFPLDPVVFEHSCIYTGIFAFDIECGLRRQSLDDEVVVAVRAVFVTLFKLLRVFPEAFLALLAGKGHVEFLQQRVVFLFGMAFGTVEPFATAWRTDGDLGVENVLAHREVWVLR